MTGKRLIDTKEKAVGLVFIITTILFISVWLFADRDNISVWLFADRDKISCEKCLDNWEETKCGEECVCEEYGTPYDYCYSTIEIDGETLCCFKGNASLCGEPLKKCVRAREKTECEKNNHDYILDCPGPKRKFYDVGGVGIAVQFNESGWEDVNLPGARLVGVEVCACRRKTLEDFSCKVLMKPILFDWPRTQIRDGELVRINPAFHPHYTQEEIYDVAVQKGCI